MQPMDVANIIHVLFGFFDKYENSTLIFILQSRLFYKLKEHITWISSMLALLWQVSNKTFISHIKFHLGIVIITVFNIFFFSFKIEGEKKKKRLQNTIAKQKVPLWDEQPLSFQLPSIVLLLKRIAIHEPGSEI